MFKSKIKSENPTFNSANTVCRVSVLLLSLRRRSFESSTCALPAVVVQKKKKANNNNGKKHKTAKPRLLCRHRLRPGPAWAPRPSARLALPFVAGAEGDGVGVTGEPGAAGDKAVYRRSAHSGSLPASPQAHERRPAVCDSASLLAAD